MSNGMLTGTVTVFVSGNKAEIKNVGKEDGKALVDLVRNRISSGSAPTNTAPEPTGPDNSSDDVFAQIKKLGELRDAGFVTPEEFEQKKAELLARL
jgi:hypothetical protein